MMKYNIIFILILFLSTNCSDKKEETEEMPQEETVSIRTEEVTYSSGETSLKGYLAYKDDDKVKPGVIVVHEWWGQNEYSRKRARMLAELGYTAFAIDMYGEGKQAQHPEDAQKFSSQVMQDMPTAKARFNAGVEFLKSQSQTDSSKIAAIGYCFGGGVVLNMALAGSDIDGVVSFHGMLPTEPVKNPDEVKSEILVLNGADDPFTTKEQIEKFEKEMKAADVNYELINYAGAKHSFTNPNADSSGKKFNIPLEYNKEADEKSWGKMKVFLNKTL